MKKSRPRSFLRSLLMLAITSPAAVNAADGWEMGLRSNIVSAGGEPANDMISAGIFFRYPLSIDSLLGFALDQAEYDFETPASLLSLTQDPAVKSIDSTVSATTVSVWYEHLLGSPSASRWFVTGGVGISKPDVKDVSGPLAGGGSFNISTDAGTEFIASLSGGWRYRFSPHWSTEVALRADRHFADWKVTDRVSGRTFNVGDYTGLGAHIGLSYNF